MNADEIAARRRRILGIAIRWGQGEPRPHNPVDVRLAMVADLYGLPPLRYGDSEDGWVARVRAVARKEATA